jgi:hypothetical protein
MESADVAVKFVVLACILQTAALVLAISARRLARDDHDERASKRGRRVILSAALGYPLAAGIAILIVVGSGIAAAGA